MTTWHKQQGTAEEVTHDRWLNIRYDRPVRYRHFVRELPNANAENGVSHRQYSRSKVRMVEHVPHVMYHGELWELTCNWAETSEGKGFGWDFRIKSEHLP